MGRFARLFWIYYTYSVTAKAACLRVILASKQRLLQELAGKAPIDVDLAPRRLCESISDV